MVKRGPMGHGSHFHRAPGSVGMASDASKYLKDKNARSHGWKHCNCSKLRSRSIDTDNSVILVKGNVPGPKKA